MHVMAVIKCFYVKTIIDTEHNEGPLLELAIKGTFG